MDCLLSVLVTGFDFRHTVYKVSSVAGTELCMAVDAAKELEGGGKKVRVVSFPCWELFNEQDQVGAPPPPPLSPL